jgi:hypothetical protein
VTDVRARTHDERAVFGTDLSRKISVNAQRRFESDFTGELHHVANKAEPIVFRDIFSLVPLPGCCYCLSTHLGFPLSVVVRKLSTCGDVEVSRCPHPASGETILNGSDYSIWLELRGYN